MSDCKGCKYWTQAIDDYANGKHTNEEPNPFCSTCEGDKYQTKGAKETKEALKAERDLILADNEALKAKIIDMENEAESMTHRVRELAADLLVEKARNMRLKDDNARMREAIESSIPVIEALCLPDKHLHDEHTGEYEVIAKAHFNLRCSLKGGE